MNSNRSTAGTQDTPTNSISTPRAATAGKSSHYDRNFEQSLIDHGIYPNNRAQKPNNWKEINDRIAQPRPSLSLPRFSDGVFETFQQTNEEALSEGKVMRTVFPIFSGTANVPNEGGLLFTNLEPLTDGTLVDARPDYYDGARPEQIDKRVRDELESVIIPSTMQHAPCLPNLFVEGKGPDGSPAVAKRQACYDGALGARGINMLHSYGTDAETMYDNNAYTISSTYHHDGLLKMYTHHLTQPKAPGGEPEYHMTQLGAWALTGSPEQFRQGASAFRNARDWTKEQRDELITAANGRVGNMPIETSALESSSYSMLSPSTNENALLESDTSADELS
ncbi:hypothetical protein FGG08_001474 [Glutinoglossum americanum]|uniref:DUF7924 domain-containing protein n=1 Tax=Glutinoglossum americanum TaxID=1670608 RepID=A0A9P8L062_9PEZI|nr:hypothetical protein FGG08_001474 [Glutinoglossum americanum]